MTLAMPELQQDGLEVSAAEERYLRRAFHRFSLPYLVVILAAVGIAVFGPPFTLTAPDSTAAELEALVAEAASLRRAIGAVRSELRKQAGDEATRLDALEGGVAKLSREVRAAPPAKPASAPNAELKSRMDHAHQRIRVLERLLHGVLEGRLPDGDSLKKSAPLPPASPSLP